MSAVTMLPVTSIPYILQLVDKFTEEKNFDKNDEYSMKETVISFSYPLTQLGNLFVYLFMGFCIFYYKHPVSFMDQLLIPVLSLLSFNRSFVTDSFLILLRQAFGWGFLITGLLLGRNSRDPVEPWKMTRSPSRA